MKPKNKIALAVIAAALTVGTPATARTTAELTAPLPALPGDVRDEQVLAIQILLDRAKHSPGSSTENSVEIRSEQYSPTSKQMASQRREKRAPSFSSA